MEDEDIEESDGDIFDMNSQEEQGNKTGQEEDNEEEEEAVEEEEDELESAADKRRRLAKQYLEDLKTSEEFFDAQDLDDEIIGSRLKQDVAEEKGYVYKWLASRIHVDKAKISVLKIGNQGVTSAAVHYPYLYTTSKDMELAKWDVSGPGKPRKLKYVRGGRRFEEIDRETPTQNGHCDEIYSCAVSPDGKWVVTGGKDRRVVVWSSEKMICQRAIETGGRRGVVLGLAFRRHTDQLYVACADLKIRTYSVAQLAKLETLYGHQDVVADISALGQERCVTVGSRDRTAMLWKIPDETRLTFRGGDSIEKFEHSKKKGEATFFVEGSLDCVSMVDDSHFVTGSDNGNVCLWSTSKKKPIFTVRQAHGMQPKEAAHMASAEADIYTAEAQVPEQQPYWITSIAAVPFSDLFFTGSWNGVIKVWKIDEELRKFECIGDLPRAAGVITRIAVDDDAEEEVRVFASLSKEPRLGRWLKTGKNGIYVARLKLTT